MITLTKSNEEMADVFDEISSFFEILVLPVVMTEELIEKSTKNSISVDATVGGYLTYYYRKKFEDKLSEWEKQYINDSPLGVRMFGARVLTEKLGIKYKHFDVAYCGVLQWAHENPKIWGNKHGKHMLVRNRAYLLKKGEVIIAKNIAKHFADVAKRLRV